MFKKIFYQRIFSHRKLLTMQINLFCTGEAKKKKSLTTIYILKKIIIN